MKKQDQEKCDALAKEVILFLRKWGLWSGVSIYTNGNRYVYKKGAVYKGIQDVEFIKNIDPEGYLEGITGYDEEGSCIWKSFSNPEHIFDMTYEGPLQLLLGEFEYEVRKKDISAEAWAYIFERAESVQEEFENFLEEKYGCTDEEGLLEQKVSDLTDNTEYSLWDPLEFDTWEEYKELTGGDTGNPVPVYENYDTYEEYKKALEEAENLKPEDVKDLWEKMVQEARKEYISDCGWNDSELINIPELVSHLRAEMIELFEKYGLWYDFCFSWSLTCYRSLKN